MWLLVMFDLPTDTDKAKRDYREFRKALLEDGFDMMQYSIYARHCASEANTKVHTRRVKAMLPPDGEVRVMSVTDKQYGKIQIFFGKIRKMGPPPPQQLSLF
jgi:CRISPR-associated protein Cas2